MKNFFINTGMLLLGIIVATSCSNEESLEQMANKGNIVQAVIENEADTRTSVNDSYQVVWTAEDKFDVWDGDTFKGVLKLETGAGSTSASFKDNDEENPVGATIGMTAFFPSYDGESSKKAFVFAEEYESLETDAPMLGSFDGSKFTFNLLTAMVRVVVADVPAGKISFTISSKNSEILTGEAVLNNENKLDVPTQGETSVSVNFTTDEVKTLTFDVPIPVQDYTDGFQVVVKSGEQEKLNKKTNGFNAVAGKLYLFGATYVNVADADAASKKLGNDGITAVKVQSVEAGDEIAIPAKSETSAQTEHIIDLSEATMPSGDPVTIKVTEAGSGDTESTVEKLTVIVPDNTTSGSFTIDAPGTTVTIQGADGTVIETIEAITAENTLIVGEGVTVKKLILKGGNVRKNGTITSIVDADNNEYTWVTTVDELTTAIAGNKNIILGADITSTATITINKALILNGNGYTLKNTSTSTSIRALNIEVNGEVTIKNLTVDASCQRAFNVINQPATLTLDNVTATAKNYAVMVATSAGAAKLDIKDSELTGAATINIAGASTTATITDTDITSIDNSEKEGYAAINFHSTADDAKVTVTGGSITLSGTQVGDDSFAGYSSANGTSITFNDGIIFNGVAEGNKIGSSACYIPYSNQTAYGFTSLAGALEWAKGGETIVLSADVEITSTLEITKDVTIDLNGKSLTNNVNKARAFKLNADGVAFTLKATDATITFGNGTYGMIEIATGVDNATVNVNGGTFEGTTDCGAFVKLRDGNNNTVSLSDVIYTEKCELQDGDTNAWVISASTGTGNKLTVSGGTYNVACGFGLDKFTSNFKNVNLTAKGMGMEIAENTSTVEGCTITVNPGMPVNKIYASCIAASTQSVVSVEGSTLSAGENAYALYVLPTGGTINVDSETNITGSTCVHNPMNNGCTGAINIGGTAQ